MRDRLRIVVLGYIVRGPLGGLAWHHLQYVLGLVDLGHEVLFAEVADEDYPSCYDPNAGQTTDDPTYGLAFTKQTFEAVGLGNRWAYLEALAGGWSGPAAPFADRAIGDADLLLNVSGVNALRGALCEIPVRALIDTDPVFQQVRVLTEPDHRAYVASHTCHFTFAGAIDGPDHLIPPDGFTWRPTAQPVHLAAWKPTEAPQDAPFTTVMQWDSYDRRTWEGQTFGMKAESFEPFVDLPSRVAAPLELALGSKNAPRQRLSEHGWRLRDPLEVTRDIDSYRSYIAGSLAEFSVAKHGYVAARSGWFSERTANYLASGRPAVVQDTGFSAAIPCGEGLLAFDDPQGAAAAIESVLARPAQHARRAREIASSYFDARLVLDQLIDRCR